MCQIVQLYNKILSGRGVLQYLKRWSHGTPKRRKTRRIDTKADKAYAVEMFGEISEETKMSEKQIKNSSRQSYVATIWVDRVYPTAIVLEALASL